MPKKSNIDYWESEEGLVKLRGWATSGLTNEQIAEKMMVNKVTLYRWIKASSAISNSLKEGKEVVDYKVENALLRRALGCKVKEKRQEKDASGKTKTIIIEKEVPPDTTAQIFWLKNRRPDLWRDKREAVITANIDQQTINEVEAFIDGLDSTEAEVTAAAENGAV